MKLSVKYIIEHEQELWQKIRWNSVPTCQCGSTHLYVLKDGRFKCKHCKKIFSDVSNTIAQNSNLKKWQWLYAIFVMSTLKSISVGELSKHISVSVTTAHRMLRKIRYYMSKDNFNRTDFAIIDEAHIGAWANMKFSKKFEYMKEHGFMDPVSHTYTKSQILAASSHKKEHILSIINADNQCVLQHIRGQINHDVIKSIIKRFGIKHIISDESTLYRNIPGTIVEQCNHSKRKWLTDSGLSTNPCENRFAWTKRIYNYMTHTTANDLQLYLNQIAFKINNNRKSLTDVFDTLGRLCCTEYISHNGITNWLRQNEIVNEPVEIEEKILEMLDFGFVDKIEHKHKIYRKKR